MIREGTRHPTFGLSSEQCELLLALESAGSMSALAERVGRDASVISRQLQKIAQEVPVLEKPSGKWVLSPLGKQLNHWTREAVAGQKEILDEQSVLRIASTREFAARVLAPRLLEFRGQHEKTHMTLLTSERGVEHLLLKGKADIGFDCGRPNDPLIRFKLLQEEPFSIVAAPSFLEKHSITKEDQLEDVPHLQYRRLSSSTILGRMTELPNVVASFDDIASMREACIAGVGWAVLPRYAVKREIDENLLKEVPSKNLVSERFGVWWHRSRQSVEPWVQTSLKWLGEQALH